MRGVVVEQSTVERTEDVDKDKKKKRRSNRRSKQNSSVSGCNSVSEIHGVAPEFMGSGSTSNCVVSNEHLPNGASNGAFHSLPTMHINEQATSHDGITTRNQQMFLSDFGERTFSNSCPDPIACEDSMCTSANKDFPLSRQIVHGQKKYFVPHWSMEAVNGALENGDVFKALFRVNAYNRIEAYCKIDGVQIDVLISGCAAQNRAVEGDTVAIKIDRLSSWTKMKGSPGTSNNSVSMDDSNLIPEVTELVVNGLKGKNKVDIEYEYVNGSEYLLLPDNGFQCESSSSLSCENVCSEPIGPIGYNHINGHSQMNEVSSSVAKLCAMISSCPSKRPTGRVVAIIERSPRRDTIVGFLSVKQWISQFCKKDTKKKKNSLFSLNREYVTLTPTDPKFPKMMVFVQDLPNPLKKRLEEGDPAVEMELVAARIDDWGDEDWVPQAHVMHVFGRSGEIEPHIAAILFENGIFSSEFSPESLSCLPHAPWEVPLVELRRRRDLRNLCIFTIDPSTATDLDDALSVEKLSGQIFRVGVHIADVSYFVLPDTAIDIEAQIRSTSVYLLQRKLPMLPKLFSEDICSLNPGVDRLAFSIFWDINLAGEVVDRWIGRTVIRSCCKLSYEHAQSIIDNLGIFNTSGNDCPTLHGHFEWSDVIVSIKSLHEISKRLKEDRFTGGALSLESSKMVFLIDEDGIPYGSMFSGRIDSNFLVEEFMLLANRTAAEVISRAYPDSALLRRHPEPNLRKLREFEAFCSKHGLELDTSSSGQLHHSLERIREKLKNDSVLFNILMNYAAKPMQLASYFCSGDLKDSEGDWGHYALAVPLYTHFTSPIRRYPDIVVHRTLVATIEAEEMYLSHMSSKFKNEEEIAQRCFSGVYFDKNAAGSIEGQEALSVAAFKHRVPSAEILTDVAAYCNERKLASRHVKDASDKLYMWVLLKKKEILFSDARVLSLGPRFMSIYIHKLAIERRMYYDEVDELAVEWLDATSTLILSLSTIRRYQRRGSPGKCRSLEEVAMVANPYELKLPLDFHGDRDYGEVSSYIGGDSGVASGDPMPVSDIVEIEPVEIEPAFFPLTVHLLGTIPVALHAVGGDDKPLDIGVRLYMSSYLR